MVDTEIKPGVEFHADTVRDVIDEEYVAVRDDMFVGMVIDKFRDFTPDDETTIYYVYIVDEDNRLVGVLSQGIIKR